MPTIEQNQDAWDKNYSWDEEGDEWSEPWGTARSQWFGSLLPRVNYWLPAPRMLEIAPGHGRWTQFLLPLAQELHLVDLSGECIKTCQQRFAGHEKLTYEVNDGESLPGVSAGWADLVFSFDSLVHVEAENFRGYIQEFARVLSDAGVAFLHHSNMKAYEEEIKTHGKSFTDRLRIKIGAMKNEPLNRHWRAESMSGEVLRQMCAEYELLVLHQEQLNWRVEPELLSDCISIIAKKSHPLADKAGKIYRNPYFMEEARLIKNLDASYNLAGKKGSRIAPEA